MSVLPSHYKPFVEFAILTGLRAGEIKAQVWEDTDLVEGVLRVTEPKSQHVKEVIPLSRDAITLLSTLERRSKFLFPKMPRSISSLFAKYVRLAKLEGVGFHSLRHTFLSRAGAHSSAATLLELARHQDPRTTRRYLKVDRSHLRATLEKLDAERELFTPVATLLASANNGQG